MRNNLLNKKNQGKEMDIETVGDGSISAIYLEAEYNELDGTELFFFRYGNHVVGYYVDEIVSVEVVSR